MAGLGEMLGGLLGGDAGKDEMAESLGLSREALDELKRLYVPTVAEQQINPASYTPELAGLLGAEQLSDSELAGVSVDPRLNQGRMKGLEQLAGLSETGLGVEDQAAFHKLINQANSETQAANALRNQQYAAEGMSDSGNRLVSDLMSQQGQANRLQDAGMQQAAQASSARRDALSRYTDQANAMTQQDYNMKANVASSKDAINKFNTQNRQDVNQYNLGNKQSINNQTAANNKEAGYYNKGLIQQKFQNDFQKAGGVAGQTNNLAGQYAAQGQAKAQGQANMTSGLLNGGIQLAAAGMTGGASAAVPAVAGAATASSGYGGSTPANSYDDFYMNKLGKK